MMKAKIQHTNKAGVKKRIDLIESKPIKSRAVIEKKPPLKSEIIAQFKVLQAEHDTLKHENNKNLMIIKKLEEKLSVLATAEISFFVWNLSRIANIFK